MHRKTEILKEKLQISFPRLGNVNMTSVIAKKSVFEFWLLVEILIVWGLHPAHSPLRKVTGQKCITTAMSHKSETLT